MEKTMKKIILSSLAALLVVGVAFMGCQNLDVTNINAPDEQRSLATPGDVESLIAGSFLAWHQAIFWEQPSMSLATTADVYSCSWGNFGMRDLSSEPRVKFNNTVAYGNASVVEDPWFGCYGAISAASDGVKSIKDGVVDLGKDNQRAIAFGKFVQGLAHGYLALMFDQAFILDETVDLTTADLQLQPYTDVMAAAIQQLTEAIDICNSNTFTLESEWIRGQPITNDQLAQLAHSFIARYMVLVARDPGERQAVDWTTVMGHVNDGITADFGPESDGAENWFDAVQWYSPQSGTWLRADYKLIGPSDESSGYANWISTPVANRDEFEMDTRDLRLWDQTRATDGTQNPGSEFFFAAPSPFPVARGTYHFSRYSHQVFFDYADSGGEGVMVLFRASELEFLKAEGMLHTGGSDAAIAAIIDQTRMNKGGYDTAAGAPVGSISDDANPKAGASLWAMLKYERHIDLLGTFSGLGFWDRRGWGELTTNTMLHFPVPAQDLETLQLGLYTHGGGTGASAPKLGANRSARPY